MPNQKHIKNLILDEYSKISYASHAAYQKMIFALWKEFLWHGMKKEVEEYLARYLECQQVKAKHQHLVGLLHPFPIPKWKCGLIRIIVMYGKKVHEYVDRGRWGSTMNRCEGASDQLVTCGSSVATFR